MTTATKSKDPIGFDPVAWIQRLRDVNDSSQFQQEAKDLIEDRLSVLQREVERTNGRPEG